MTPNFSILLSTLLGLFSLIAVGYLAVRANILPASVSSPLSALLIKIALPTSLFVSMIRPLEPGFFRIMILTLALTFFFILLFATLCPLLCRLFRISEEHRGMWSLCCTFCNNAFMGFPIIYSLFGDEGLALGAIVSIPFGLLVYTLGVRQVCQDLKYSAHQNVPSWRAILFTGINLSIVLGLVFYFCQIPVPNAILVPLNHLANITTPLSMMVTGMNLAKGRISDVFRDRDALLASLTRLVLYPALLWAILSSLPVPSLPASIIFLALAMPSAANSTVLGEQFNGQKEFAARTVCLSSLLCIVTIPLVSMLL